MLWNIRASRKRQNRWARVHAIVEPTKYDNFAVDADRVPNDDFGFFCESLEDVSLEEAILWAQSFDCPTTLFLYDAESLPLDDDDDIADLKVGQCASGAVRSPS